MLNCFEELKQLVPQKGLQTPGVVGRMVPMRFELSIYGLLRSCL